MIANWATLAVMLGAAVTGLVYGLNPDWPNANDISSVCSSAGWSMAVMDMIFWTLSYTNTAVAVQNYNLSIMGVPIPHGRK
jgi:hypothetical protein